LAIAFDLDLAASEVARRATTNRQLHRPHATVWFDFAGAVTHRDPGSCQTQIRGVEVRRPQLALDPRDCDQTGDDGIELRELELGRRRELDFLFRPFDPIHERRLPGVPCLVVKRRIRTMG